MFGRTNVIIINGAPLSGKDTFVELCANYCDENEMANVFNISSVDPIKDTLIKYGWDGRNKSDRIRDMIAGIKDMWIETQNGPTVFLFTNIYNFHIMHATEDNICFCHIREPEEISKLVKVLNGMDELSISIKTLLISRDCADGDDCRDADNIDIINSYDYDIKIANNSLDELKETAEKFVDDLLDYDKWRNI